jgi:hypothetical protein
MREGWLGEKAEDEKSNRKDKGKKKKEDENKQFEKYRLHDTFAPSATIMTLEIFNFRMLNLTI